MGLPELIDRNLAVHVLTADARMRGIEAPSADRKISAGSYESLIDLLDSCDRVVGIL